jgi:hypothetical protein
VDSSGSAAERYAVDLERTVDRLRSMGLARLAASFEPEQTRADAAHALAQRLCDDAADLELRPRRQVPRLADHAAGDQLAVCGLDLLAAARDRDTDVAAVLTHAADALLDLRRRI